MQSLDATLRELSAFDPFEFHHISDKFRIGAKDADWLPAIARQGWVVITSDQGTATGGPKLPKLCVTHEITHVLLSGRVHGLRTFEKLTALQSVWGKIVTVVVPSKPGSGFRLKATNPAVTAFDVVPIIPRR